MNKLFLLPSYNPDWLFNKLQNLTYVPFFKNISILPETILLDCMLHNGARDSVGACSSFEIKPAYDENNHKLLTAGYEF